MTKGRKPGFGKVKVGKRILTTQDYKNAVIDTLKELKVPVTTDTIISYASAKGWVDDRNRPRKAVSHPLYKILSIMVDKDGDPRIKYSFTKRGRLQYEYVGE